MSPLVIAELVLFVLATLAVSFWALRRASWDWAYQLRVVRTLWLLGSLDSPWNHLDPWEAVLVSRDLSAGSRMVAFAPLDRPHDVALLQLDEPLGDLAEGCIAWCAVGTPLLFAGDGYGGAVLHGPNACLVGQVVSWNAARSVETRLVRATPRPATEVARMQPARGPRRHTLLSVRPTPLAVPAARRLRRGRLTS